MSEREWFESGPLVHMRLSVSRAVFRLGPAWSVIAGAMTVGALGLDAGGWLRVLTAAVLADLAWGAIRQIIPVNPTAGHDDACAHPATVPVVGFLPYAQADAPLARWLHILTPGQPLTTVVGASGAWQGVLIVIGLALILSVLLGWPALILTGLTLATIWLAAALARRGDTPALALALLDVGWPWLLGMTMTVRSGDLAGAAIWEVARAGLLLAVAFTLLQNGMYRWQRGASEEVFAPRPVLAWVGQASVLAALILLRSPWAVAAVAALLTVPSYWLARPARDTWVSAAPWWWAASLVAAAIAP